jgi:hypothetical protein
VEIAKLTTNGFKCGIGNAYSRAASSSNYSSASSSHTFLEGGNPTASTWGDWVISVVEDPAVTRFALVPLTAFISNGTVVANLQQYLASYFGQYPLQNYSSSPEADTFQIEQCNCQYHYQNFPSGYVVVGANTYLDDSVYYLTSPSLVCRPCMSYAKGGDFGPPITVSEGKMSALFKPRTAFTTSLPMPGLDLIGSGYDVVMGEYRPLQISQLGPMTQTFTNPFTNQVYSYPSNVQFSQFGAGAQSYQQIFNSSTTYAQYLSQYYGIDASY